MSAVVIAHRAGMQRGTFTIRAIPSLRPSNPANAGPGAMSMKRSYPSRRKQKRCYGKRAVEDRVLLIACLGELANRNTPAEGEIGTLIDANLH